LKKISVLHLPTLVGGNASFLSRGERINGINSKVMKLTSSNDYNLNIFDYDLHNKFKSILFFKAVYFYIKYNKCFNVFHYNFGMTSFSSHSSRFFKIRMHLELIFLKIIGKKIVVTFQGSDARQMDYCLKNYKYTYFNNVFYKKRPKNMDKRIRQKIEIFDKYADLIYTTNPDLKNVLPFRTKFRPYTKIDITSIKPFYSDYLSLEPLRILHAPSRQHIKGTQIIVNAVNKLKINGYKFIFELIENLDNLTAIEAYQKADLVIDQLLVGWYGGFSVEVMALGKPVMCYIREEDMKHIPNKMNQEMPIIKTNPDSFYDDLKKILDEKKQLIKVAEKSRMFVEEWHNIESIAEEIIKDYKNIF